LSELKGDGLQGSRVVVTGGLGFIGTHLVERLLTTGSDVVVIDKDERKKSPSHEKAKVVVEDVSHGDRIAKWLEGADVVFHLAAITDYELSLKAPSLVNRNNILSTLEILRASPKGAKIVYTSSAAVYGEADELPVSEAHRTRPISPYGVSKLIAENYCYAYNRSFGLRTTCLRLFNVYGPGQSSGPYSSVVTKFFKGLSEGEVTIYGDGSQIRDFVYIGDAVDALLMAAQNDETVGRTMNIGSGTATTVTDLLSIISEICDRPPAKIRYEGRRPGEISRSQADIALARKLMGFEPKTSIRDGLKKYYGWLNGRA